MNSWENPAAQQLNMLLLGQGFNFYKTQGQLRADDLLIRQRVGAALGSAAGRIEQLAAEFQRKCIPAPSRQQPYPPAELMARLGDARALRQKLLDREILIQGLPAPAQDKVWQRLRDETNLLQNLLNADAGLLELAASFESEAAKLTCEQWKTGSAADAVESLLTRLDATLRTR